MTRAATAGAVLGSLLVAVPAAAPALAAATPVTQPAPSPGVKASALHVTGYAVETVSPATVRRNAAGLDTLTVAASMLDAAGRRFSAPSERLRARATQARRLGLRTELMINNWSNARDGFDARAARRLLRHPKRHQAAARQVARHARAGDFAGVNVDLERLVRADADGLLRFLRALRRALPDDATLSIDVGAATSLGGYRRIGFRLGAISRLVDVVQVMTYDQHGPGWSGPGPIGGLRWQRRSITAALRAVPAAQLDLGVAGYGYLWRADGSGRSVSVAQARALARRDGVRPRWQARAGEWRARLSGKRTLWYSDVRSLTARKRLADDLGVRGVAIWQVGSADRLTR